jgi:hypothetical protein
MFDRNKELPAWAMIGLVVAAVAILYVLQLVRSMPACG